MKVNYDVVSYQNELIFFPFTYYNSCGKVGYPVVGFEAVSPVTKKYKEWLHTDKKIFMKSLKYCEELFNKDVLEIKQLVKDTGDLNSLLHRSKKILFCMMIVTLSIMHFYWT